MWTELERGEQRPVWVKALHINDWDGNEHTYGVEKIILLSPDGEEMWDWLIFEEDVEHIPRSD